MGPPVHLWQRSRCAQGSAGDDGRVDGTDTTFAAYVVGASYGTGDVADLDGDGTIELVVSSGYASAYKGSLSVLPTGL